MLLLTLLITFLALLFATLAGRLAHQAQERLAIGIFLALLVPMYAPQLSYLIFGTLSTGAMLACAALISTVFAGALYWAGKRYPAQLGISAPPSGKTTLSQDAAIAVNPAPAPAHHGASQPAETSLLAALGTPYLAVLGFLALSGTALSLWISAHYSQFGWDGWAYHASAAAWFHQQDGIVPAPWMEWIIGYPKNIELLSLWAFRFDGDDSHIDMVNLLLHWLALPFAYGLGRRVGLQPAWALAGALLYFCTPELIEQSWSGYIDQAFADSVVMMLYLLFTWMQTDGPQHNVWAVLLGSALGHLAQTKGTGLHLVVIVGAFVLVHELLIEGRRKQVLKTLVLVAVPTALLGAGWYLHTWWVMGNPLYPFRILVPGTNNVLFEGTMELKESMLANLGQRVNLEEPWPLLYFRMFSSSAWGLQFFALGLPAMLLCVVKGNAAMRWLLAFALAYLVVTPFSFIERYTLVVTAAGALAFAYIMQAHIQHRIWSRALLGASVAAVALSLIPLLVNLDPPTAGARNPPPVSQLDDAEDFQRFAMINAEPGPQRIGLVDLARGGDNPHWYFYFGPRWENRVEPFAANRAASYDFAVCATGGKRCQLITGTGLFEKVLEERGVEVYRRASH